MHIVKNIKKQIQENPILLYMKGTPDKPSCGYSARAVEALSLCDVKFAYVNILENEEIRTALPKYANWPTFPQLWVQGELIGGCDIIVKLFESGDLKKILQQCIKVK
ncbi:Grx4 family monothiol glutaredoxin [Buchnera aphidicola (Takecallis taiwana)]|uniref:Grx4 family monothiol glutaredoxin n=1 Tax=Buchnera aphidicola TaxID=9 RepID=UPI0031B7190C